MLSSIRNFPNLFLSLSVGLEQGRRLSYHNSIHMDSTNISIHLLTIATFNNYNLLYKHFLGGLAIGPDIFTIIANAPFKCRINIDLIAYCTACHVLRVHTTWRKTNGLLVPAGQIQGWPTLTQPHTHGELALGRVGLALTHSFTHHAPSWPDIVRTQPSCARTFPTSPVASWRHATFQAIT